MIPCSNKKNNGVICGKPAKFKIKEVNETEYIHPRCGIHSRKVNEKDKVLIDDINQYKNNNSIRNNDVTKDFHEKLNLDNRKKTLCYQHFSYLALQDENEICQYGDNCEFSHKFTINYTDI